ncbi:MAG: sulfotransferase family protein [Blastocatellia bacterium]
MRADRLDGWTPVRLYWEQSSAMVDWCYSGERRFTDPFFDQTIERCMRHPFSVLFRHRTPMDALGRYYEERPGLAPTGFIFHLSRCGSTLISQMLAALPRNVVISEAPPVDAVLRANQGGRDVTDATRADWLRWMISALGQPRSGEEKHLFIKFDSWSLLSMRIIRQAFPDVPWVFAYRDPVEVLVSQIMRRGGHMVPGVLEPELLGMDYSSILQMRPAEYCARVLAQVCAAALEHRDGGEPMFINYRQLPEVVWSSLLDFFRVDHTAADIDRMRRVSQFNAKNPSLEFVDDAASKHSAAGPELRDAAGEWVMPLYERLEAARLSRGGGR